MTDSASQQTTANSESLRTGALIGERFVVKSKSFDLPMGEIWMARDQQTNKKIGLFVLNKTVMPNSAHAALQQSCKRAASLSHRSIVRTYGVGKTPVGKFFVAQEWTDGKTLVQSIEERSDNEGPFTLRGAYNVLAHLSKALTHAHRTTYHGALRPSVVWVSSTGRVRLSDFGLSRALVDNVGHDSFVAQEAAFLAPEIKGGGKADRRSDIFGLGTILYQLLTGRSPVDKFVAPSKMHAEADARIDAILLKCLSANPADRYETADAVRNAMLEAVGQSRSLPPVADLGTSIDVSLNSLMPGDHKGRRGPPSLPPEVHAAAVDIEGQLAKLAKGDAPRWLVTKDGSDHGPYTAVDLVDHINTGEFGVTAQAQNLDTRETKPLQEWDAFIDFVEVRKLEEIRLAEVALHDQAVKNERRMSIAKGGFGLMMLGALAVAAIFWMASRKAAETAAARDANLDALYKAGQIDIEGQADLLPDMKPNKRRRGKRGGKSSTPKGPGGFTYESAMNRPMEMGDVTQGGGESRLKGRQVAATMNKHVGKIHRQCVVQEHNRGGVLGSVKIDLAIAGNGSVLGSTIRAGSPAFQQCVTSVVRSVRFPTFGAPRMGARYSFNAN